MLRAPTLAEAQAAGFPVGGEPLALDVANTLITTNDPPTDLLADAARARQFWRLQAGRLPVGARLPTLQATRALRGAIRGVLEARVAGQPPPGDAVSAINAAAAAAPTAPQLVVSGAALAQEERWQASAAEHGATVLAVVARSAIDVLTSDLGTRLRRCANPTCSMLFVADSPRRRWCTPNICGNRARVARHYRRSRATD